MSLTNFFSLIAKRKIKNQLENSDLIAVGTKDPTWNGGYQPTAIRYEELKAHLLASVPAPVSVPSGNGSIYTNGFRPVGCINEDITLPENGNFEYTGLLTMCVGKSLTVPVGTTLTIV